MKNELLNIADYLESLEERIATLDARVIELESKVIELEKAPSVGFPVEGQPSEETSIDPVQQIDEQLEQEMKMATLEARLIELESKEAPSASLPVEGQPSASIAPPISDLRRGISLGDRFLFQRELFEQNGELMQKTLETLNDLPDLGSALAYLDKRFGSWDKDSTAYQLFYAVLQRRF